MCWSQAIRRKHGGIEVVSHSLHETGLIVEYPPNKKVDFLGFSLDSRSLEPYHLVIRAGDSETITLVNQAFVLHQKT